MTKVKIHWNSKEHKQWNAAIRHEIYSNSNKSVTVHVCFVLFIVCLYICVYECLLQNNNHKTKHKDNTTSKQHSCVRGPLWECGSIWSGASGLPYFCARLVCVSDVMELLAVWRHNKPKTKKVTREFSRVFLDIHLCLFFQCMCALVSVCMCIFLHVPINKVQCNTPHRVGWWLPTASCYHLCFWAAF